MSKMGQYVMTLEICEFCARPMASAHVCPPDIDTSEPNENLVAINALCAAMGQQMNQPGVHARTNEQLRQQANRRQSMATSVRLAGGEVKTEYQPLDERPF